MGVSFRIKQYGKMFIQNVYLPAVYNYAVRRTSVDNELVVFADAHNEKLPESMQLAYSEIKKRGYKIKTVSSDFSKMSYMGQLRFMTRFMKIYARSSYVFISSYFLPVSSCRKREETKVIQLWHSGGLLKKMGYDAEDDFPKYYHGKITANYDHVTVSAPACVKYWERAWRMQHGIVFADGISRTDIYFDESWNNEARIKFEKIHPDAVGKKICVYAPSFSGNASNPRCMGMESGIVEAAGKLSDDWYFCFSLHPHLKDKYMRYSEKMTTSELLPVADLLITDYSSVLFDYSIYKKPFLLFCPDYDDYKKKRGFYKDPADFPAPLIKSSSELVSVIRNEKWKDFKDKYEEFYRTYMGRCDGKATSRILRSAGMRENIRMIFLDLDDTTLDGHGKLDDTTIEAMTRAYNNGIEIVVASGRSFSCLPHELEKVPFIKYAICSNGANVFQIQQKKCLKSFLLTENAVRQIVKIADDYDVFVDAFLAGEAHSEKRYLEEADRNPEITPHRRQYLHSTRIPEKNIREFINKHVHELDCLNIICFDKNKRNEIVKRINNEVDDVYLTSSIPHLLEISYKDAGKESGLIWIAHKLDIPVYECAAFGNADNDAGMISEAGLGVAVRNSSKKCFDAADLIIGPNDGNSVAVEINRIADDIEKNRSRLSLLKCKIHDVNMSDNKNV